MPDPAASSSLDPIWPAVLDALGLGEPGPAAFQVAETVTGERVGFRLFTVMTSDPVRGEAARLHSSNPAAYPVSGKKPIVPNRWTATVLDARQAFVANTIEDIATVFPDSELIASLGCGSVVNVPVVVGGAVIGTANILHEAGWFTAERVAAAMALRPVYALALLAAERNPA